MSQRTDAQETAVEMVVEVMGALGASEEAQALASLDPGYCWEQALALVREGQRWPE